MNSGASQDTTAPLPSPAPRSSPLRIGEVEVYADSNEIHGVAGMVRLRPLLMQVLLRLATTPGVAVTREQLINDVWSRKIVNDEVLSRAIAELRIALDDDSREPRYIETLPKVGYRLVATVSRSPAATAIAVADAQPRTPTDTTAATAESRRSRSWVNFGVLGALGLLVVAAATYVWKSPASAPPGPDWARFAESPNIKTGT